METEGSFVCICTKPHVEKERGEKKHGGIGAVVYKWMPSFHGSALCRDARGVILWTMGDPPSICYWISPLFASSEKFLGFSPALKCCAVR